MYGVHRTYHLVNYGGEEEKKEGKKKKMRKKRKTEINDGAEPKTAINYAANAFLYTVGTELPETLLRLFTYYFPLSFVS